MGGSRAAAGSRKAGSLSDIQPSFERIWLEAKKWLPEYAAQNPANIRLRSRYALRLYSWAKKHVEAGEKEISLEDLRKVLGLESVKNAAGNIVQEAPLQFWANFRQRALDVAIAEVNVKTGLNISLESLERSKLRRVTTLTFAIKNQEVPKG
jgi:plasmid replication initiation protein